MGDEKDRMKEELADGPVERGSRTLVPRWQCNLLLAASLMTYLLITMGGIVCVTESGLGCPDWPGCYGRIVPPPRMDAIIEYTHRLSALLALPFLVAAAIVAWRRSPSIRWVSRPPMMAIALLLAVVVFGAMAVLHGLSPGLAAVDLGSALMVMGLVVTATVVAFAHHKDPTLPDRLLFQDGFARLALWAAIAVFFVLVSGVLVAESGSMVRCLGWPLLGGLAVPADPRGWLQIARLAMAAAAGGLILVLVLQAWRTQHTLGAIRGTAVLAGATFVAEIVTGALLVTRGITVYLLVGYVASAAALWAFLVALAVLAGLAGAAQARTPKQQG
jgi:cytochrome c oxidase assembly protein subunit 15